MYHEKSLKREATSNNIEMGVKQTG
jgi:hypothetical protein